MSFIHTGSSNFDSFSPLSLRSQSSRIFQAMVKRHRTDNRLVVELHSRCTGFDFQSFTHTFPRVIKMASETDQTDQLEINVSMGRQMSSAFGWINTKNKM